MGTATKRAVKREAKRQELAFSKQPEARIARLRMADSWLKRDGQEGRFHNAKNAKAVHEGIDRSTLSKGRSSSHIRSSL